MVLMECARRERAGIAFYYAPFASISTDADADTWRNDGWEIEAATRFVEPGGLIGRLKVGAVNG
jgi:hypothetical protein